MSRSKDAAIAAANHDRDRSDCSICGDLSEDTPPCYEWERVSADEPEPIPEPLPDRFAWLKPAA